MEANTNVENLKVLAGLVLNDSFRHEMESDVDAAIAKAKYFPDNDFKEKLKTYGKNNGFANIGTLKVTDVNESFAKEFGLDPKW